MENYIQCTMTVIFYAVILFGTQVTNRYWLKANSASKCLDTLQGRICQSPDSNLLSVLFQDGDQNQN